MTRTVIPSLPDYKVGWFSFSDGIEASDVVTSRLLPVVAWSVAIDGEEDSAYDQNVLPITIGLVEDFNDQNWFVVTPTGTIVWNESHFDGVEAFCAGVLKYQKEIAEIRNSMRGGDCEHSTNH